MTVIYEKQFGKNIRDIREERNITRSAIAKIEVGQRHVYPDEIKLLKEILNTTFDKLFYCS